MIKSSASTLLTLLFVALTPSILAEEEETKFPSNTPVIMLTEDNFDEETGLGRRPIKTPWFIYFYTPWCPACRRMVPIWEEIARRYQGSVNIAAIESDEHYVIKDRIGVEHFPTFMYFAENNKMYKFEGTRNQDNLTDYIDNERWQDKIEEGDEIPVEVDSFKKLMRKIFSPIMIPVVIVLAFISLITYVCCEDKKYEKEKFDEARKVKQEIIRRKIERAEREELFKSKFD